MYLLYDLRGTLFIHFLNIRIMKTKSFVVAVIALLTISLTLPVETLKAYPPRWVPAHGYRANVRHIYFPEQNIYYDTRRDVYIYPDRGRWVTSVRLPDVFAMISLATAPKIELALNTPYPYRYNERHMEMYRIRHHRDFDRRYVDRRDYREADRPRRDDRHWDEDQDRHHDRDREHRHGHDRDDD